MTRCDAVVTDGSTEEYDMCGRYSLTQTADEIAARFDVEAPAGFEPRYNVAPTETMPVVRRRDKASADGREAPFLRWGLVPFWADDPSIGNRMINARSETVADKPAYRAAFGRRRCLVPTDGFYEWVERDGQKWPIRIEIGGGLGAFAGIWERWTGDDGRVVESYSILTTDAAPVLEELHDRMPVWAPEDHWDAWLTDDDGAGDVLTSMLASFPEPSVTYRPVSPRLNRPGEDDPEVLEPVDEPGLPRRMADGG